MQTQKAIAPAIIFVDGEEFMPLGPDVSVSEQIALFDATVKRVGGEVASWSGSRVIRFTFASG